MLFTIRRMLVCSDLSENSELVLKNAEKIRHRTGAEVDLLHVSVDSEASGAKLQEQMKRHNLKGNLIQKEGDVPTVINEVIESGKYDLLIIGHNSQTGIWKHLLGSVARKLLSSVPVPTLVLKKELQFDKMGCLIDNTSSLGWMITSSLDYYRSLKFETIEFVNLWHDLPEPFGHGGSSAEFKSRLWEEIRYFEHEKEKVSVRVEPARELQVAHHLFEIVQEDQVDLAVMKRNRGKNVKTMMLGSETMRMLELEPLNLLILPV